MSIRKFLFAFPSVVAIAITLVAILSFPNVTRAANIGENAGEGLELRLSARPLDESRIWNVSPEERELLREKQKLFDIDERVNSYLALQHQIRQMQAEIVALRPRVAALGSGGYAATGGTPGRQADLVATQAEIAPGIASAKKDASSGTMMLPGAWIGAVLALLAASALLLGLRRYRMAKMQHGGAVREPPDWSGIPQVSPAAAEAGQTRNAVSSGEVVNSEVPLPSAGDAVGVEVLSEVDSMIEEAELYAIHGHPDKAIEILNEIVQEHPEKIEVWLLLLSIFRNDKNARQFESIAKKFLVTMDGNDAWKGIQEAGRSIDPNNPLYFDPDSTGTTGAEQSLMPGKRRLLGDILVDMQAISAHDLKSSLADFDHLRDGRLGNYLVARRLIKQDQLDEALQQQSKEAVVESSASNSGTHGPLIKSGKPRTIGDVLLQMGAVTEQELDHVLASYDPQRHGHCGTYLVSSGIITRKQLHAALLQQLGGAMAVEFVEPAEDSPAEDGDYIPWDMPDRSIR